MRSLARLDQIRDDWSWPGVGGRATRSEGQSGARYPAGLSSGSWVGRIRHPRNMWRAEKWLGGCFREPKLGKVDRCIAHNGADRVRLASRSGSDVDLDIGSYRSERDEQGFVGDVEALGLCTDLDRESSSLELFRDERAGDVANSLCKAGADGLGPAPLLAARWGQRLACRR